MQAVEDFFTDCREPSLWTGTKRFFYVLVNIQDCHVQKDTVHAGVLLSDAFALSSPRSCWVSACYACWFHARYVMEYLWLAQCMHVWNNRRYAKHHPDTVYHKAKTWHTLFETTFLLSLNENASKFWVFRISILKLWLKGWIMTIQYFCLSNGKIEIEKTYRHLSLLCRFQLCQNIYDEQG